MSQTSVARTRRWHRCVGPGECCASCEMTRARESSLAMNTNGTEHQCSWSDAAGRRFSRGLRIKLRLFF